ncbi:MAG TPA: hypothetical protein PLI65_10365 [Bacteroidales bacterium]|nr:hypothetical protein [Bacteroidales bacterium]HPR58330.1 hypothetical protein [Bacteroidales bacterium]HRW97012.1 hypothetical protein [Bacteroidales bacterium]
MSIPIKELDYEKLRNIIHEKDHRVIFRKTNVIPEDEDLYQELQSYINYDNIPNKSVLGLDIYQYSTGYGVIEQALIPFLFRRFMETTIDQCFANHKFIFQKYDRQRIYDHFISTGDGGFFIFDTPLHSILFAINFAIVLRVYNAFHFYPKLRRIIGSINLRYAITYDKIYKFGDNYFGRALINNARILQRDNLNRCLIDQNVNTWFLVNIGGIENLQVITMSEIANIHDLLDDYDSSILDDHPDEIFGIIEKRTYGIINSDILKIGKIQSKSTELNIYLLHLQVSLKLINDDDPNQMKVFTISLGNLNTAGI